VAHIFLYCIAKLLTSLSGAPHSNKVHLSCLDNGLLLKLPTDIAWHISRVDSSNYKLISKEMSIDSTEIVDKSVTDTDSIHACSSFEGDAHI